MIKKILVAVDLEDLTLTDKMLQMAGDLARLNHSRVTLLHVSSELPADVIAHLPADYTHETSSRLVDQLEALIEHLKLPDDATHVAVRHGSVYRKILQQAEADQSDLIVVGCHRPDAVDVLLGSNAARVSRHASCSVFVVR